MPNAFNACKRTFSREPIYFFDSVVTYNCVDVIRLQGRNFWRSKKVRILLLAIETVSLPGLKTCSNHGDCLENFTAHFHCYSQDRITVFIQWHCLICLVPASSNEKLRNDKTRELGWLWNGDVVAYFQ
jgi:hypothetical protein